MEYQYQQQQQQQQQHQSPYYSDANSSSGLRHRAHQAQNNSFQNYNEDNDSNGKYKKSMKRRVVQNIDIFPKTETDLTVQTEQGGLLSMVGIIFAVVLVFSEWYAWSSSNNTTTERIVVDQSLNKKMKVELNITFPSLHCDDLHMNLMDVAGDVQVDVEDTMVKKALHLDGSYVTDREIEVEMNQAHAKDEAAREAIKKTLKPDYCGPCYGGSDDPDKCCNFCQDVLDAYKKKSWHVEQVRMVAEQCVREHKNGPKNLSKGQGCQIAGNMSFKRLNGNFHIAMGEGVERNGQFIHTFLPDEMELFNASHIIHELKFGPVYDTSDGENGIMGDMNALNGVKKIVTRNEGSTGTFQYFLKIVPTTYKGENLVKSLLTSEELRKLSMLDYKKELELETNRYFTTERFLPLMEEELNDDHYELADLVISNEFHDDGAADDDQLVAGAHVGGNSGSSHSHYHNHRKKNPVLPGVFFVYQIYPFAIEVTQDSVPFSHLLIRIMATLGGLYTIIGWLDTFLYARRNTNIR